MTHDDAERAWKAWIKMWVRATQPTTRTPDGTWSGDTVRAAFMAGRQSLLDDHPAVLMIAAERRRQIEREGWSEDHDDMHGEGDLAMAAISYALPPTEREGDESNPPAEWPWVPVHWKPTPKDRVRELVKAGALIAAEIDRLLRLADRLEQSKVIADQEEEKGD